MHICWYFFADARGLITKIILEAYRNAALEFGASKEQAESLVQHHVALTGISRYVKFEYFLNHILKQKITEKNMNKLIQSLNKNVVKLLKSCECH